MSEMIATFDPNAAALENAGIFGLPYTEETATLVYLPVPWEVTTSYGGGTSLGPAAIFRASHQVDLFDLEVSKPYEAGLYMLEESPDIYLLNEHAKKQAQYVIAASGRVESDEKLQAALATVNKAGDALNQYVYNETKRLFVANQIPAIVGGDHSVPFGAFRAAAERFPAFGILHFDAHSDTRAAYEGFTWSHASIMYNALEHIPQIKKLVQVGIRDFCEAEYNYTQHVQKDRVHVFFDLYLKNKKMTGSHWAQLVEEIIAPLPEWVWVSFDIDGLDPRFCPHTGTPVPGGLDYVECCYLIAAVVRSGRKIIGFDLNEVAPGADDEWDANVAARLLYKMSAWTLVSQGKAQLHAK